MAMAYHVRSIALSDKGWTNNYIAAQWFEKCFLPQAKARNTSGKTILLIYDGHKSHETIELRETAVQHEIQLYRLPAHTSHRLQPLDVGVFGPLQRAWQNRCAVAMDDSGEGITRQQVVKEYMMARTESFKETTILSAWKKSGIVPFNPGVFTSEDFGPSLPLSFKALLPKSFPMQSDNSDSDSPDDHVSVGDSSESEQENEEGDTSEEEVGDCADCLNQDVSSELPFLAQATDSSPSLFPPPSNAPTPTQHCLSHEEGGEPPSCMDLPTHLSTGTHSYNLRYQSPQVPASSQLSPPLAVPPGPPQSLDERLAASEKRNEELQHEVEKLKAHCILSGGVITRLQKRVNRKENKRKSSARAKKTTGEARVLTSEQGRQELQQLREESQQKEMRQHAELARKATEDKARRKRRADPTHTFTGLLNKSRRKEDLADIASALLLSDSGKKDDIFERIIKEFDAHPELKTNPRFEGLFHSRPRKRARVDDGTGPSNLTGTLSLSPTRPTSLSNSIVPGLSSFTYESPPYHSTGTTDRPAQDQPNSHPQYIYYT